MKRLAFVLMMTLAPLWPLQAQAQVPQDRLILEMQEQGFTEFRVQRTFLGRIRITAKSDEYRREVVLNPGNGLILRDYWRALSADEREDDESQSFGGGAEDDDDDDDDGDDDDEDDAEDDSEDESDDSEDESDDD